LWKENQLTLFFRKCQITVILIVGVFSGFFSLYFFIIFLFCLNILFYYHFLRENKFSIQIEVLVTMSITVIWHFLKNNVSWFSFHNNYILYTFQTSCSSKLLLLTSIILRYLLRDRMVVRFTTICVISAYHY
jgi:hypothetical protein